MNKRFAIIVGTLDEVAKHLQKMLEDGWTLNGELIQTGKKINGAVEVAHAIEFNPRPGNMPLGKSTNNENRPTVLQDAEVQSTKSPDVIYDWASGSFKQLSKHTVDAMMGRPAWSKKSN